MRRVVPFVKKLRLMTGTFRAHTLPPVESVLPEPWPGRPLGTMHRTPPKTPPRTVRRAFPVLVGTVLVLTAMVPVQDGSVLARYAFGRSDAIQRSLPDRLREVSGLAVTGDGRLFAHDDERARVYQVDPRTAEVLKRVDVGPGGVRGDFEGLAVVGRRFFLVESDGTLYEFEEGDDREDVPYRSIPTDLGSRCEVEGLAYDPLTEALLLACKSTRGRALSGHLVIFAVPLATLEPEPEPRYRIPYARLSDVDARGRLHPSGLEVHPERHTLVVVGGRERGLVEIDRAGTFVGAVELSGRLHPQAEGITFVDGDLLVADEGGNGDATLTRYTVAEASGPTP